MLSSAWWHSRGETKARGEIHQPCFSHGDAGHYAAGLAQALAYFLG